MEPRDRMFPGTPTLSVLKQRPRAMELFERNGIDPWSRPQASIGEVCRTHGLSWSRFAADLDALKIPDNQTDWRQVPVYHLLDHLRDEHRKFEHVDLPSVRYALDMESQDHMSNLGLLRALAHQWPEFTSALLEHLRHEEDFLFPKIMRHFSSLNNGDVDPNLNDGSVHQYVATALFGSERRFKAELDRLRDSIRFSTHDSPVKPLVQALIDFHNRLRNHSRLEFEVLYPIALEAEKELVDREAKQRGTKIYYRESAEHGNLVATR